MRERWPRSATKRLKDLLGDARPLSRDMRFVYTWDHGYETLTIEYDKAGSSYFSGAFHPVEGLCIGNPCDYCGAVSHDGESDA